MSKTRYFELPSTVGEILNGKNIKEVKPTENLATLIDSLADNEAALIGGRLIPSRFSTAKKFFRYGNELLLRMPRSKFDAMKRRIRPSGLLIDAFSKIPEQPIAAVSFLSLYDFSTMHRYTLDDVIQGVKIYSYSVRNSEIDIAEDKEYERIKDNGANLIVSVPSRTEKKPRLEFTMKQVPLVDNKYKYLLWSVVEGSCYCEDKKFESSLKSRVPGKNPINYCPHEVAAYIAIAARQRRKENNVTYEVMPFPTVSPKLANYWKKLTRKVMIDDERKRPLNKAERNILLTYFIRENGPREAMAPRNSKYSDYQW